MDDPNLILQGTNMNSKKYQMTSVPKLAEYHVSKDIGFMLPEPLTELPEYFEPWNKLNRDLVHLLNEHKLRNAVEELPLLDDALLFGHRQIRLAYMILCFVGNGFIWQEGDDDIPKVIPRQLAVPWYAVSRRLGVKPALCQTSLVLSNYVAIDKSKPLNIKNMKLISKIPGEKMFEWFVLVTSQVELDAAKGVNAVVEAMKSVLDDDSEGVCFSLEAIASTLRSMKETMSRMHERLPSNFFYGNIRPFLSGWGGKGSRIPEGIIFEEASESPICVLGGSAAQSSPMQCFDAGLGVNHNEGHASDYLTEIRDYMPPAHADFIRALAKGPSIKDYVLSSSNDTLKQLYGDCISALQDFRTYHLQLVTKYIVVPARKDPNDTSELKGTGGTDIIPFLKHLRDTTIAGDGH